tara:strand:+ start:52 stop:279 length:228 start_codon:yes stop_codon:yes gene_type:complete
MILNDIKRVPPNALLGAYVTMPNGHEFKCVNYYVDIQNNNFLLELQSSKDPTSRQGYCLSHMTDWSISLQGGFIS